MMKYERPIMNISMFKLEHVSAEATLPSGIEEGTNVGNAYITGQTNIQQKAQRAMVVIRFNDGTTGQ